MNRIGSVAVAFVLSVLLMGAGRDFRSGYSSSSYNPAGLAETLTPASDTTRILIQDLDFPNRAARAVVTGYIKADGYYDVISNSEDGSHMMWGHVYRGSPDSVLYSNANVNMRMGFTGEGTSSEDSLTYDSLQRYAFLWVSGNGIEAGTKVVDAHVIVNVDSLGWRADISPGAYITCHLDTISNDYQVTNWSAVGANYGSSNDLSQMALSWNHMDGEGQSAPWVPSLDNRRDYHDFGPRSGTTYGPRRRSALASSLGDTAASCLRFDVTDAVQQVVDRAVNDQSLLDRGLLFVFTAHGPSSGVNAIGSSLYISAGNRSPNIDTWNGGNPSFTATTATWRGDRPWGGAMPIGLVYDSSPATQAEQIGIFRSRGLRFTTGSSAGEVFNEDGTVKNTQYDTMYSNNLAMIDFQQQGFYGTPQGNRSADSLDVDLSRRWYGGLGTPADTSQIIHASIPAGNGPEYGWDMIARQVAYGWKSSRGKSHVESDLTAYGSGAMRPLFWSKPANMYAMTSYSSGSIVGDGSAAKIHENLNDYIDKYYGWGVEGAGRIGTYQFGHPAGIVYVHDAEITAQECSDLIDAINSVSGAQYVDVYRFLNMRLSGASYLPLASITVAAGYDSASAAHAARASAAKDSVAVSLQDRLDELYVAPK